MKSNASFGGNVGGTLRWTAPELLEGEGVIGREADIYAFGMLAFEV